MAIVMIQYLQGRLFLRGWISTEMMSPDNVFPSPGIGKTERGQKSKKKKKWTHVVES